MKKINIQFVEQPMPASMKDEYIYLRKKSPIEIIADESVETVADFNELSKMFHGINVKLMKASGYGNAIDLLKSAKSYKMKTMIGCMIESSLAIYSALNITSLVDYIDLDGSLLVANEPFGLITESDGLLSCDDAKFEAFSRVVY